MRRLSCLHIVGTMAGPDHHTAGGTVIRVTRGMIGATAQYMTHIGVGAGALAGVVIHTTQDLSHRTITTTTIRLTMAVAAIAVLLWHTVQIALRLAVDLRTLTEQLVPQLLSRV